MGSLPQHNNCGTREQNNRPHQNVGRLFIAAGIALTVVGCATPPELVIAQTPKKEDSIYSTQSVQTGKASYYYGRWIGRKTANGEIYRASDVTAAHKTLPFNTKVRVTNLKNGKQVIVRINNRGPFIKGRIIDLSLEAAKRVEMTKAGVVPVKLDILKEIPVLRKPNLRAKVPPPTS